MACHRSRCQFFSRAFRPVSLAGYRCFLACLSVTATLYGADNDADPEVLVIGQRQRRPPAENGQLLRPVRGQEARTDWLLRSVPALHVVTTGEVTGSGAALPTIRHHPHKATEFWLNGVQVVDPYSGLAFADIDLTPFHQLGVYYGHSEVELPTTNPVGGLVVEWPSRSDSRNTVGARVGRGFGIKGWQHIDTGHYLDTASRPRLAMFGAHHQSRGDYRYFDHGGTPFNSEDDREVRRRGNDTRSWQLMPLMELRTPGPTLNLIGGMQQGTRGLSHPFDQESNARSIWNQGFVQLRVTEQLSKTLSTSGYFNLFRSRNQLTNHLGGFRSVSSEMLQMVWEFRTRHPGWTVSGRIAHGASVLRMATQDVPSSSIVGSNGAGYLGVSIGERDGVLGSLKIERRVFSHRAVVDGTQTDDIHTLDGLSVGLSYAGIVYAHAGTYLRPPTAFETFGDFANVLPAPDLDDESLRHLELGAKTTVRGWQGQLSLFHDRGLRTVVLLPAFGGRQRAANIKQTRIRGIDVAIRRTRASWSLSLSGSYVRSDDVSGGVHRGLPMVPKYVVAVGSMYRFGNWSFGMHPRYRGPMFKDLGNDLEIQGVWFLDMVVSWKGSRFSGALNIENALDTKAVRLIDLSSADRQIGKIGNATVDGYPLPGRQLTLSARMEL